METGVNLRILCTGGCGFIGAPLVKRLVDAGHDVTVIDDLSRGSILNLNGYVDRIAFIEHDMKQPLDITVTYDVVFDLAARIYGITRLYEDQPGFLRENTLILLNTLESVKACCHHYVYVSSSCIYNYEGCPIPHRESDARVVPKTGYDLSKRFGEEIVRLYAEQYGFRYTVVRPFNVYGAGEGEDAPHVITDLFRRILQEKAKPSGTFWILGSGEQTRSFTYLEDFIDGLLLLMDRGEGGVFNVGNAEETRVIDLLQTMFDVAGLPFDAYEVQHRPAYADDVQRRQPDTAKIRDVGWTPKHTLREGLENIWRDLTASG